MHVGALALTRWLPSVQMEKRVPVGVSHRSKQPPNMTINLGEIQDFYFSFQRPHSAYSHRKISVISPMDVPKNAVQPPAYLRVPYQKHSLQLLSPAPRRIPVTGRLHERYNTTACTSKSFA